MMGAPGTDRWIAAQRAARARLRRERLQRAAAVGFLALVLCLLFLLGMSIAMAADAAARAANVAVGWAFFAFLAGLVVGGLLATYRLLAQLRSGRVPGMRRR